jgi:hypothetical protein
MSTRRCLRQSHPEVRVRRFSRAAADRPLSSGPLLHPASPVVLVIVVVIVVVIA